MSIAKPRKGRIRPRLLTFMWVVTFAALSSAALPRPIAADEVAAPETPENIRVPDGHVLLGVGRAFGTQNYICLPAGTGFGWTLFGPQANLFDEADRQVMTHFLSPNPDEQGVLRATWQDSRHTSAVWARAVASSTDPDYLAAGAIAWLLLEVVGSEPGPSGSRQLTRAAYIQRLNTKGGVAPAAGCAAAADVGNRAFVPYAADYFFYRKARK